MVLEDSILVRFTALEGRQSQLQDFLLSLVSRVDTLEVDFCTEPQSSSLATAEASEHPTTETFQSALEENTTWKKCVGTTRQRSNSTIGSSRVSKPETVAY